MTNVIAQQQHLLPEKEKKQSKLIQTADIPHGVKIQNIYDSQSIP